MSDNINRTFATNSGMLALWSPQDFQNITDYDSWERELLDDTDISRHIQQGAFVPVNIQSDGSYQCVVRSASAGVSAKLSDRERRYLVVSSEPYLFRSGDTVAISGIEHISRSPDESAASFPLSAGDWAVTVHLIDWPSEPGAKSPDGNPTSTALSDFVILLNPATAETRYRTKIDTFEKPEDT
jgi:hypothetical protein